MSSLEANEIDHHKNGLVLVSLCTTRLSAPYIVAAAVRADHLFSGPHLGIVPPLTVVLDTCHILLLFGVFVDLLREEGC